VDPARFGAHRQLGLLALSAGRAEEAVREFEAERRVGGEQDLDGLIGVASMRRGDWARARTALERELRAHPENAAARESLEVVESRSR
jgi:hypothetical protein